MLILTALALAAPPDPALLGPLCGRPGRAVVEPVRYGALRAGAGGPAWTDGGGRLAEASRYDGAWHRPRFPAIDADAASVRVWLTDAELGFAGWAPRVDLQRVVTRPTVGYAPGGQPDPTSGIDLPTGFFVDSADLASEDRGFWTFAVTAPAADTDEVWTPAPAPVLPSEQEVELPADTVVRDVAGLPLATITGLVPARVLDRRDGRIRVTFTDGDLRVTGWVERVRPLAGLMGSGFGTGSSISCPAALPQLAEPIPAGTPLSVGPDLQPIGALLRERRDAPGVTAAPGGWWIDAYTQWGQVRLWADAARAGEWASYLVQTSPR